MNDQEMSIYTYYFKDAGMIKSSTNSSPFSGDRVPAHILIERNRSQTLKEQKENMNLHYKYTLLKFNKWVESTKKKNTHLFIHI